MKGAEEFVSANLGKQDSTFNSCLHLIIYAYQLLEKKEKYSRNSILTAASNVRGSVATKVELEDYLRNDIIKKFIDPNKKLFDLDNYLFQSGAEEFSQNIKTGILDIKVESPLYNGTLEIPLKVTPLDRTKLSPLLRGKLTPEDRSKLTPPFLS